MTLTDPEDGGITFIKKALKNWENRKGFLFAIVADTKMVGDIGLNLPDFEKQTIRCDYAISPLYWGQGIVTQAVKLALSYAFKELSMEVVFSSCLDRNPASRRVLEKNGFSEIGKFIKLKFTTRLLVISQDISSVVMSVFCLRATATTLASSTERVMV